MNRLKSLGKSGILTNHNRSSASNFNLKTSSILLSIMLTGVANANVVGSDMQLFNPTTDGLDFVTVESSETLLPGYVNFGLFMNYAVNTLPYFEEDGQKQSKTEFNDSVLAADLNVGIGVTKDFSLGLSLPQILTQSVSTDGYHGKFRDNGNTEVRLNAKYRLLGDNDGGIALGGIINLNRTKDNPYVGDTNAPVYTAQIIGDKRLSESITVGLNLGYRWRSKANALPEADPIKPLPNQIIGSAAASYHLSEWDTKIILEVFGSRPASAVDANGDRTASSNEALLGVKYDVDHNLAVHGGVGSEIQHGLSTPDWRMYAGVNYVLGPKPTDEKRISSDGKSASNNPKPFAGPTKSYERVIVHDILFEFDSDERMIGPSRDTLAALANYLNQPPLYTKLMVIGHTDSLGPTEYNDNLSKSRAETIKKWLVDHHKLDSSKISTEGRGEREPVANNGNFQGRQLNRRVEFRIYRDQKVEKFDPNKKK